MEDLITQYVRLRQRAVDDATRYELGNRVIDVMVQDINPAHEPIKGVLHVQELADPHWPSTPDVLGDKDDDDKTAA